MLPTYIIVDIVRNSFSQPDVAMKKAAWHEGSMLRGQHGVRAPNGGLAARHEMDRASCAATSLVAAVRCRQGPCLGPGDKCSDSV